MEEPALSEQDSIALGYQFQGWFTSPGYEKSSLLKSWPQRFAKDTTVYAKAEKMHKVRLLAADRSRYDPEKKSLPTGNVRILYGDNQSQAKMLGDQYDYIANDEFLELPSRLPDGTAVSWWIRVASEKDLTPLGYSEENDAWQIRPGSLVRITGEEMDTLHFYAVTEKDVALFFHTQIRGITYMKYGHRGETVPVPACDVAVNRLFFEPRLVIRSGLRSPARTRCISMRSGRPEIMLLPWISPIRISAPRIRSTAEPCRPTRWLPSPLSGMMRKRS